MTTPTPPQPDSRTSDDGSTTAPTPSPRARIGFVLSGLVAVTFVAIGTWTTYWADLRNDQFQLIHLGQTVCDGGRMYVDCWENKPPGIAWINALAIVLAGGRLIGPWALPGVTLMACLGIMTAAATRLLSRRAACWTLVVSSMVYTLRLYDTPSINPDFYSSVFELAAIGLWLLALTSPDRRRLTGLAVAAGLIWAASVGVKQTGIVAPLALSAVAAGLALSKHDNARRWGACCALAWTGFALGAFAVAAVLAYRQTLGPAWDAVFEFNRGLATFAEVGRAIRSWSRIGAGLSALQLPLWLALAGILVTVYEGKAKALSRPVVVALIVLWILQVLFALIGPSKSMRYWQSTFPAMLWLAALGAYHLEHALRRSEMGRQSVLIVTSVTAILLLGGPLLSQHRHGFATSDLQYASGHNQRTELRKIGEHVRELVPDDRPIYVWAYDTGVYLYAKRRAASTYTYPRSHRQMDAILADLATGQADAILIPKHSAREFDRWCDETCHRVRDRILAGYEVRSTVGQYDIWVRSLLDPGSERINETGLHESVSPGGAP
ncbi:MAG: hypothetical protein PVI86_04630 [Phycisphaerae bacterium]